MCKNVFKKRYGPKQNAYRKHILNDIKKLDPRKAHKYLGIEEDFDIQRKNEKEKLKKEYLRRLRLVLVQN
jgi:hypothetical protein